MTIPQHPEDVVVVIDGDAVSIRILAVGHADGRARELRLDITRHQAEELSRKLIAALVG